MSTEALETGRVRGSGWSSRVSLVDILQLAGILAILFVLISFRSLNPKPVSSWQYKVEEISDTGFADRMNVLGKQGWEMVSARRPEDGQGQTMVYEVIFKRPTRD